MRGRSAKAPDTVVDERLSADREDAPEGLDLVRLAALDKRALVEFAGLVDLPELEAAGAEPQTDVACGNRSRCVAVQAGAAPRVRRCRRRARCVPWRRRGPAGNRLWCAFRCARSRSRRTSPVVLIPSLRRHSRATSGMRSPTYWRARSEGRCEEAARAKRASPMAAMRPSRSSMLAHMREGLDARGRVAALAHRLEGCSARL